MARISQINRTVLLSLKIIEYKIKRAMNSPAGVEAVACVAQWHEDFLDL
jgi:hypothetical protein